MLIKLSFLLGKGSKWLSIRFSGGLNAKTF